MQYVHNWQTYSSVWFNKKVQYLRNVAQLPRDVYNKNIKDSVKIGSITKN